MKFTNKQIINEIQDTLRGTCTFPSVESAVPAAFFNLIADKHDNWQEMSDWIQSTANDLADAAIKDGIVDDCGTAWAGTGFGLCEGCGWWCDDCYNSTEDFDGVCSDCAEEAEDEEDY